MNRLCASLLPAILFSGLAFADFDSAHRSINGTGETLPEGDTELGLGSIAYGITPDWMVRAPTLSLLVGAARAEVRRKFTPFDRARVSPFFDLETPRHARAGADFGYDFGSGRQHSLTAGMAVRYGPLLWPTQKYPVTWRRKANFIASFEYDWYQRGNAAYTGVTDGIGYVGYTWSFVHVNAGLISSPASGFWPLPYIYWRL